MAVHIHSLSVKTFKSLYDLSLPQFNDINIITGDNDSGKTSLLEAIEFFKEPRDFSAILLLAGKRRNIFSFTNVPLYVSFLSLFNQGDKEAIKRIAIEANFGHDVAKLEIEGQVNRLLADEKLIADFLNKNKLNIPSEINAFEGKFSFSNNNEKRVSGFSILEPGLTERLQLPKTRFQNIHYLPPFAHLRGSSFNHIIRNENYKKICLKLLSHFDSEIEDLLLLQNEFSIFSTEYIQHRTLGKMPLSTYGDGIKKVISVADALIGAKDGILLIDEIETAVHAKHFEDFLTFIVEAVRALNIQLFITTHSIEAIDAILKTQEYDKQDQDDRLSVITLKREKHKTFSRTLSGRRVYENREVFDFEVRV